MTRTFRYTLFALFLSVHANAQIHVGGLPLAWQKSQSELASKPPTPTVLPKLDVEKAWVEDSQTPGQNRFAAPINTNLTLENSGVWTDLSNGDRVWQCEINAPDALGLVLLFDQFDLPSGSRFFAYTPDHKQLFGAYSDVSCQPSGKFTIGVLKGERAMLEYFEPATAKGKGRVHLFRADYAYDKQAMAAGNVAGFLDYGQSLPCNVNVNCPTGADWQTEKKGVARILMVFDNGVGWCTGSMIANTSGNFDPYFLTAQHCQQIGVFPHFDMWRFDFDYEAVGCAPPGAEPQPRSVLGCERVAFRTQTDFMLLKINPIPITYGVYFNGWNRNTTSIPKTTYIHHPVGDIKKISADTSAPAIFPQAISWGGAFGTSPANSHWKVIPDVGIFQPGSSGGPLFDTNKRIIGQLHGGNQNQFNGCIVIDTYWGRFDQSWNVGGSPQSQLKDWLDPTNTNAMTQNGYSQPIPAGYNIAGNVKTWWNVPMPNVTIYLSGSALDTTKTDTLGNYTFTNVPGGNNYVIRASRDTNDMNGISTFDLVLTSKHILNVEALNSPWKMISADVNRSNSITTFDIVESRKMLLGLSTSYAASPSWRFYPSFISFSNPLQPFDTPLPEQITLTNLQGNYNGANFTAVKVGDVNNSADPGN